MKLGGVPDIDIRALLVGCISTGTSSRSSSLAEELQSRQSRDLCVLFSAPGCERDGTLQLQ